MTATALPEPLRSNSAEDTKSVFKRARAQWAERSQEEKEQMLAYVALFDSKETTVSCMSYRTWEWELSYAWVREQNDDFLL